MFQDVLEWFQPHWTSYAESRILDLIQNSTDLTVQNFRISKFPPNSIVYEGMGLAFNQSHQHNGYTIFHWGNLQRTKTPKALVVHLMNEMT